MTVVKYKIKYRNLRGGDDEPEKKKEEEQEQQGEQQQEDAGEGDVAPSVGDVAPSVGDVAPSVGDVAPGEGEVAAPAGADEVGSEPTVVATTDPQNEEDDDAAPAPSGADEDVVVEVSGAPAPVVVEVSEAPAPVASTMFSFGSLFGTSGPSQADYDALKAENAELKAELTAIQGPIMTGGDIPDITISLTDM